jgi:hypothetical protein
MRMTPSSGSGTSEGSRSARGDSPRKGELRQEADWTEALARLTQGRGRPASRPDAPAFPVYAYLFHSWPPPEWQVLAPEMVALWQAGVDLRALVCVPPVAGPSPCPPIAGLMPVPAVALAGEDEGDDPVRRAVVRLLRPLGLDPGEHSEAVGYGLGVAKMLVETGTTHLHATSTQGLLSGYLGSRLASVSLSVTVETGFGKKPTAVRPRLTGAEPRLTTAVLVRLAQACIGGRVADEASRSLLPRRFALLRRAKGTRWQRQLLAWGTRSPLGLRYWPQVASRAEAS